MLRLKRNAAAERKVLSALGFLVVARPVCRINLKTRLGRPNLDAAAVQRTVKTARLDEPAFPAGHDALVENPVVIVALSDFELRIRLVDTLSDTHSIAEVEGGSSDVCDFTGRNLTGIGRGNL